MVSYWFHGRRAWRTALMPNQQRSFDAARRFVEAAERGRARWTPFVGQHAVGMKVLVLASGTFRPSAEALPASLRRKVGVRGQQKAPREGSHHDPLVAASNAAVPRNWQRLADKSRCRATGLAEEEQAVRGGTPGSGAEAFARADSPRSGQYHLPSRGPGAVAASTAQLQAQAIGAHYRRTVPP